MDKEKILQIAERNLTKAKRALYSNYDRKGITESEIENLSNNVEYAQLVYDLIVKNEQIAAVSG
jgi:hypothetical protein